MKRALCYIMTGGVVALLGYVLYTSSLHLAASRIYHADECQNVFMARVLATGQGERCFTSPSLLLVPLMWLSGDGNQSTGLFATARLISLLIFWLNLVLLVLATGEKLVSGRGLIALTGAIMLAPLWDFGFEVRPENLLLTGLLLTWCAVRVSATSIPAFIIAGALATAMQFTSGRAFLYTLPIVLVSLAVARGAGPFRWKLALAWVVGALGTFLALRFLYGAAGLWEVYLASAPWRIGAGEGGGRFEPWMIAVRVIGQSPLLSTLLAAALVAGATELRRKGHTAFADQSYLPESVFCLWLFAVTALNPKTHPHSLVLVAPFAYLAAFRYLLSIWKELWAVPLVRPLIFTVLIFAHGVPFYLSTRRHWDWPNHRQENLMRAAEQLTDPVKDPVYDGIGMVPTRRSIHFHWLLPGPNGIGRGKRGESSVREMLAERPAAVIIQSYRTDWLLEEDHDFIRERYVPLADDFWVLGTTLPAGGGEFEIHHPGRYHLAPREASNLEGTYDNSLKGLLASRGKTAVEPDFVATLDGAQLTNRTTVELTVGKHRLETTADCVPTVVWAGPRLEQAPRVNEGSRLRLFVNWY